MFGTKLRALLQRRKNRDLFDLGEGLKVLALDADKLVASFEHYLAVERRPITRPAAEQRMLEKLTHGLTEDVVHLLPVGVRFNGEDALDAFERVWSMLISRLEGSAWKSTESVVAELRKAGYPTLFTSR